MAGIRDNRRSCIAYQDNLRALLQSLEQLISSGGFVVLVIAECRLMNPVMIQELYRVPRVFACDQVCLAQEAECSRRDIFQISYRSRYQIERAFVMRGPIWRPN